MTLRDKSPVKNIVLFAFWLLFIMLCFVNRDKITVESIVNFTPENTLAAAIILLLLFSLKSVTVVVYGGLLYIASGIMLPLPIAVFVNAIGTVLMVSIPFAIGKKSGKKVIGGLIQKNPKLKILKDVPKKSEFFISLFVRVIGLLPADLIGMYLGASGIGYGKYLSGSMIGLAPAILSFSIMGMSANDISSPAFIISAAFETGLMLISVSLYFIWYRKKKNNNNTMEDSHDCKKGQYIGNA